MHVFIVIDQHWLPAVVLDTNAVVQIPNVVVFELSNVVDVVINSMLASEVKDGLQPQQTLVASGIVLDTNDVIDCCYRMNVVIECC